MHCPLNGGYIVYVPGDWAYCLYLIRMKISREAHDELVSVIEDTVEYACDKERISGEVAWTVIECLATAKLAQLKGLVA